MSESKKRSFKQNFIRNAIISAVTTFIVYMIITNINWGLLGLEFGGGPKPDAAVEEAARTAAVTETIVIGGKTWMKRNLNVWTRNSWCYENSQDSCNKYGRLYTWRAAKRACDSLGDGWRLPMSGDWFALEEEDVVSVVDIIYEYGFRAQHTSWWTAGYDSGGEALMIRLYEKELETFEKEITARYCVRCIKD